MGQRKLWQTWAWYCCFIEIERFLYDLEKWFWLVLVIFFYQPMDENVKTCSLRFLAKENPNMEKAFFDWPIVLQYDVKAKYESDP